MSDILIKGMEMPDNCFECPCCRYDSVDGIKMEQCNLTLDVFDANYFERWNGRAQNCPLIDIPTPHGRLADLDKMIEDYWDGSAMRIDKADLKEIEEYDVVIEGSET